MDMWIWLSGIAGSPRNNGWIEVLAFWQPRTDKNASVTARRDVSESGIFAKCARGEPVDTIVLAIGPQLELTCANCLIVSVTSSGQRNDQTRFSFAYETMVRQYSGNP